jgi:hypothetical protein
LAEVLLVPQSWTLLAAFAFGPPQPASASAQTITTAARQHEPAGRWRAGRLREAYMGTVSLPGPIMPPRVAAAQPDRISGSCRLPTGNYLA